MAARAPPPRSSRTCRGRGRRARRRRRPRSGRARGRCWRRARGWRGRASAPSVGCDGVHGIPSQVGAATLGLRRPPRVRQMPIRTSAVPRPQPDLTSLPCAGRRSSRRGERIGRAVAAGARAKTARGCSPSTSSPTRTARRPVRGRPDDARRQPRRGRARGRGVRRPGHDRRQRRLPARRARRRVRRGPLGRAARAAARQPVPARALRLGRARRERQGRFLAIASAHGLVASPYKAGYVSAKHGVLGLVETLALEGADQGITATAICPGFVRTPLVEAQLAAQARGARDARGRRCSRTSSSPRTSLKRLIEPDGVADGRALPARPGRRRVHRRAVRDGRGLDSALTVWSCAGSSTSSPSRATASFTARRRRAVDHAVRALPAGPPARGRAGRDAAAAHAARRGADARGRGAAAARRGDPRRGRARPRRRWTATPASRAGACASPPRRWTPRGCPRRSPRSTAPIPACRSRCATRRRPRSRRSSRAAPPTSASRARTARRRRASRRSPLAEQPLRVLLAPDDPLAGADAVAHGGPARAAVHPRRARHRAARDGGGRLPGRGLQPRPLFEVSDPATVRFLAHAGLGVSIVPASWLEPPGPDVAAPELAAPAPRHRVALLSPPAARRRPAGCCARRC